MTKEQAIQAKANWLSQCLEFGWKHSDLDNLSEVWDKFKDEYGNMRPAAPSLNTGSLEEAARKILDKYFPHNYYEGGTEKRHKLHDDKCFRCDNEDELIEMLKEFAGAAYVKGGEEKEGLDVDVNDMAAMYAHQNKKIVDGYYNTENDLEQTFLWAAEWQAAKSSHCRECATDIINNLLDAIPAQTEDKDWWPDGLRDAIENGQAFLEDKRFLAVPSRPSLDIDKVVDELRAANPYQQYEDGISGVGHGTWEECCDKLKELLNQPK